MEVRFVVVFKGDFDEAKARWLERRLDWEVGQLAEEEGVDYDILPVG